MPPLSGPPNYPLTLDQFRFAVRRGLGRAVIHLRTVTDTTPYRDIVREACTHDQRYDVMFDALRDAFHADLVLACTTPSPLADELIPLLGTLPDDADEWVLADTMYELATRGDQHADQAWWEYVETLSAEDVLTYDDGLVLRGERGLLLLAERVGDSLSEDDSWQYIRAFENGDRAFGEGWTKGVLQREAASRPRVAAFLHAKEEWERICALPSEPSPPERPEDGWRPWSQAWPLLEAWSHNQRESRPFSAVLWARNAPEAELASAARTLLQQHQDSQIRAIANTLRHRPWPLEISLFIEYLNQLPDTLADIAMLAMRETQHPALRDECRRRCADGRLTGNLFNLMRLNTQPGDAAWIEDALTRNDPDDETIHGIGHDLWRIPTMRVEPQFCGIRQWLYEHNPCSYCREGTVKDIITCGDASAAWIMEEARHDASPDTRTLVVKALRGEPIE